MFFFHFVAKGCSGQPAEVAFGLIFVNGLGSDEMGIKEMMSGKGFALSDTICCSEREMFDNQFIMHGIYIKLDAKHGAETFIICYEKKVNGSDTKNGGSAKGVDLRFLIKNLFVGLL